MQRLLAIGCRRRAALQSALVPALVRVADLSPFGDEEDVLDAYFQTAYGPRSRRYLMLRQAWLSRRLLLLVDGLDDGGETLRCSLERQRCGYVAEQEVSVIATARTCSRDACQRFATAGFETLRLAPLDCERQREALRRRLGSRKEAQSLLAMRSVQRTRHVEHSNVVNISAQRFEETRVGQERDLESSKTRARPPRLPEHSLEIVTKSLGDCVETYTSFQRKRESHTRRRARRPLARRCSTLRRSQRRSCSASSRAPGSTRAARCPLRSRKSTTPPSREPSNTRAKPARRRVPQTTVSPRGTTRLVSVLFVFHL